MDRHGRRLHTACSVPMALAMFFSLSSTPWLVGCGDDGGGSGAPPQSSVTSWGTKGTGVGQLNAPAGFFLSRAGTILMADTDNHRIEEFDPSGHFVSQWGAKGTNPGQFSYPAAVAVDSLGNIYVADSLNNRIQKFDSKHNFILQWGTQGHEQGQFIVPFGLSVDGAKNVYVADMGNSRIEVFSSDGEFIRSWGEKGSAEGRLQYPAGIAISSSGMVYVADTENHRIQVFSVTGKYHASWGTKGSGRGDLLYPIRIALDDQGSIYVVDNGNHRLQKFDSTGAYLGEWRGEQVAGGQFKNPHDIIISPSQSLLLDEGTETVYQFDPHVVQPQPASDTSTSATANGTTGEDAAQQAAPIIHDNSTWMGDMSDTFVDKNLSEVVIPGTHDSGTWAITSGSALAHDGNEYRLQTIQNAINTLNEELGVFSDLLKPLEAKLSGQLDTFYAGWSKTQYFSIADQLSNGVRYFDFRVSSESEGFYLVHAMLGDSLQHALSDIQAFCQDPRHQKEILLIDINHMYYNDTDGGMTMSQLQALDTMIAQTLVYGDGRSMMVDRTTSGDMPVNQIWAQKRQVLVFVSDARLLQGSSRYWDSTAIRSIWDETNDLGNLQTFLTGEMTHIQDGTLHVSQSIRTEAESDIINGACSWLEGELPWGVSWVFKKFVGHWGYSTTAPQDLLSFESDTLASISGYTGLIGAAHQGPKIQIINNFGDDVAFGWAYDDGQFASGYVDYAKALNVKYFGDGGPTISLNGKVTLDETTQGPPSIAQLGAATGALLAFGSMESPRRIVTLTTNAGSTVFGNKQVSADTTSTFPSAGAYGHQAAVAWTGVGNNFINFRLTADGTHFSDVLTDDEETSAGYPLGVASYGGEVVIAWQGGDGRMNVKRYPGGANVGPKVTFAQSTKYGTSLIDAGGNLDVTGVSAWNSFFSLSGDASYNFSDGDDFPLEWAGDTVSIAYIHGHVVLAWIGGDSRINLFIKGDNWYKRTLGEWSESAPSIANIQGTLYLAWRGGDNAVNVAMVNGL